jgi:hypothetical protein
MKRILYIRQFYIEHVNYEFEWNNIECEGQACCVKNCSVEIWIDESKIGQVFLIMKCSNMKFLAFLWLMWQNYIGKIVLYKTYIKLIQIL